MGGMISATILAIYFVPLVLCAGAPPLPAEAAPGISRKKGDMPDASPLQLSIKNLLSGSRRLYFVSGITY
ncbi:hypothetical protein ACNKHT_15995 [Shigella flexneri]